MKFSANPLSTLKFAFVLFIGMLAFSQAQAQQINVGVVSYHRIQNDAPQMKAIQLKLNQEFDRRVADVQDLKTRINDAQTKYERAAATMTDSDRAKAQRDLGDMAKDLQRKNRELEEDVNQRKNEELDAFWTKVNKIINDVAVQNKLDLVLQEQAVAYVNKKIDITDKVLVVLSKN